jgi:peroxiredoxin
MTAAPELSVSEWLNTDAPISLASLRGKVVVLHAFQMLCPGCVSMGIPQAERIRHVFDKNDVAVIGLHTVFEHHAAMTPVALKAFVHEYRLAMPIGIDTHSGGGPIPDTMRAYELRGTPSLILIDRAGAIRYHHFGKVDDLALGAQIALLCVEPKDD